MKIFFAPYDSMNPYQRKMIEELAAINVPVDIGLKGCNAFFKTKDLDKADVIHFHWFEPFIKSNSFIKSFIKLIYFLIRLFALRKDKRYVWTVHNLVNHEKKNVLLDRLFLFFFTKMIDVFCVHNSFAKKQLLKKYSINKDRVQIIPHGNYANDYEGFSIDDASFKSEVMGIKSNKRTFTFLGHIKAYKGVLDLIKAFKLNNNLHKSQLLICGNVSILEDIDVINKEIDGVENIIFKPGFVEEKFVKPYLKHSDVMIYPYKNILTSGALILGMSMKKTCLASNVGSMTEFLDNNFIFNSIDELSVLMKKIEEKPIEELLTIGNSNYNRVLNDTWGNMAMCLKEIYINR